MARTQRKNTHTHGTKARSLYANTYTQTSVRTQHRERTARRMVIVVCGRGSRKIEKKVRPVLPSRQTGTIGQFLILDNAQHE